MDRVVAQGECLHINLCSLSSEDCPFPDFFFKRPTPRHLWGFRRSLLRHIWRGNRWRWRRRRRERRLRCTQWRRRRRRRIIPRRKFWLAVPHFLRRGAHKLVMISHLPNLTHTALVFLPSQFPLRHFSPQPSFLYFQLHSLVRCLVPTGDFVEVAMHGALSSPCGWISKWHERVAWGQWHTCHFSMSYLYLLWQYLNKCW